MFLFFITLGLFCLWKLKHIVQLYRNHAATAAVPQPPLDSFYGGHSPSIEAAKRDNAFLDLLVTWTNQHGPFVLFWIYGQVFFFVTDPALLRKVATNLEAFSKVDALPNRSLFGQKIIGTGSILSGNGLGWAVKRKVVSRLFTRINMRCMFEACRPHMEQGVLNKWREWAGPGTLLDLHQALSVTFLSYLQVFGFRDFQTPEQMSKNVFLILEAIPKPLFERYTYLVSNEKTQMTKLIRRMRCDALRVVSERLFGSNGEEMEEGLDMLGCLISANQSKIDTLRKNPEKKKQRKKKMSTSLAEDVVDDIMTLCLVWDNMVKQVAVLFIFLEKEPQVQSRMFAELRANPLHTFEAVDKLEYTEKCLLEAMRMGPALLRGTRNYNTTGTRRVGPYVINKPTVRVHFSEYVMQMNPEVWAEPTQFDPDRWNGHFSPDSFSYMPFWVGSRGCLGKHMAMMLMKLTLSVIARNFQVQQQFDPEKPPLVNQNMAVMRIINRVDCLVSPIV